MKCGPEFCHVPQYPLNPLPLWAGPQVGAAALETVWRPLRKLQIEPLCDQQVNGLELTPKIQMHETRGHLHPNVHSSRVHISYTVGGASVPSGR